MKETIKNFIAMAVATAIWGLGFVILFSIFFLFESGPLIEEWILLLVAILLFSLGIWYSRRSKRLEVALENPLFPNS